VSTDCKTGTSEVAAFLKFTVRRGMSFPALQREIPEQFLG
jgi:hypothetical protein